MKNEAITSSVSKRICDHMNKDHVNSLLAYAKFYAGIKNPIEVKMLSIDQHLMNLDVDGEKIQIKFDHILKDSTDAHQTLVAMLNQLSQ